ncbi:MAG: DUF4249 domain-containing protein [Flavobacteriia bacterium]|jgi:hypothetical protein|nr:DUF4249 domain-containing protein [Cryomorphaceae bacterium]
MKTAHSILFIGILSLIVSSCTKEVKIDIPGYEEQLVIDGNIETGMPPIVLISRSSDIYAPTNLDAYLNGFVSGAVVTVSNGTKTVELTEICTDNLPPGSEAMASAVFGIPIDQLASFHICAYTSFDSDIWGEVGKTYNLTVTFEGKTYTSTTSILQPTALDSVYWKTDDNYTDRGYSWATLSDPLNQYDAYRWEAKPISDPVFYKPFQPFTDDQFFNGKTFDFSYENASNCNGTYEPAEYRCYYKLGDTVVIKVSKLPRDVFEFMEKKYTQIYSSGNPFATPINLPTNIVGGALGIWAGYSPWYDTLICLP